MGPTNCFLVVALATFLACDRRRLQALSKHVGAKVYQLRENTWGFGSESSFELRILLRPVAEVRQKGTK